MSLVITQPNFRIIFLNSFESQVLYKHSSLNIEEFLNYEYLFAIAVANYYTLYIELPNETNHTEISLGIYFDNISTHNNIIPRLQIDLIYMANWSSENGSFICTKIFVIIQIHDINNGSQIPEWSLSELTIIFQTLIDQGSKGKSPH